MDMASKLFTFTFTFTRQDQGIWYLCTKPKNPADSRKRFKASRCAGHGGIREGVPWPMLASVRRDARCLFLLTFLAHLTWLWREINQCAFPLPLRTDRFSQSSTV